MEEKHRSDAWKFSRDVLTIRSIHINVINYIVDAMLSGVFFSYKSLKKDENEDKNGLRQPTEMLNTLNVVSTLLDHKKREERVYSYASTTLGYE